MKMEATEWNERKIEKLETLKEKKKPMNYCCFLFWEVLKGKEEGLGLPFLYIFLLTITILHLLFFVYSSNWKMRMSAWLGWLGLFSVCL